MALRALQHDPCPLPCQATFDKVTAKFRPTVPDGNTSPVPSDLRRQAFAIVVQKTGDCLTLRHVDKRLRSLKKAVQPGPAKAHNTHTFSPSSKHSMANKLPDYGPSLGYLGKCRFKQLNFGHGEQSIP